jgi:hypothetical protein
MHTKPTGNYMTTMDKTTINNLAAETQVDVVKIE